LDEAAGESEERAEPICRDGGRFSGPVFITPGAVDLRFELRKAPSSSLPVSSKLPCSCSLFWRRKSAMASPRSFCLASSETLGSKVIVGRKGPKPLILPSSSPCKVTVHLYRVLLDFFFPSSILFTLTFSLTPLQVRHPPPCLTTPPSLRRRKKRGRRVWTWRRMRFICLLALSVLRVERSIYASSATFFEV